MKKITITAGKVTLHAELDDNSTARQIWDALPITARANVWGDEIYFRIPVALDEAPNAQIEVDIGTLAYWPPGDAFCIFYGPTPASSGSKPAAASPVNLFGRILGDATQLRAVHPNETISIAAGE